MSDFSTCDLCDAHGADPALRVLPPVFASYGGRRRFAGPVSTVKCFEDNSPLRAAVGESGWADGAQGRVGRVLVVDGGGSQRRALLGGNLAATAARNGWAGVVIDGAVRDLAELAACALGVRALACVPLATLKRDSGQRDLAVQLQGVWVRPGDWLYADDDGIVLSSGALA